MVTAFNGAIFRRMKRWARRVDLGPDAECGAVTFIQRFTKTLTIAPHLHVVALDGLFVDLPDDAPPTFIQAPPPDEDDLRDIARRVFLHMQRVLERGGYLDGHADAPTPLDQWFLRALEEPTGLTPTRIPKRRGAGVEYRGFSIHAGVTVPRGDLKGRSQLCRYVARPPFAEDQLRWAPGGRVELTLRSPARNGQHIVTLEPMQLMRRLAWLVPPPSRHQVRYAGILAPAAKRRRHVTPTPPPQVQLAFPIENARPTRQTHRPSWAQLLARVYDVDAERCPTCGGHLRPVGAVTHPFEARRVLPTLAQARAPPQPTLPFAS
jgi:hypothetical protein